MYGVSHALRHGRASTAGCLGSGLHFPLVFASQGWRFPDREAHAPTWATTGDRGKINAELLRKFSR